jgi:hypothetical protein
MGFGLSRHSYRGSRLYFLDPKSLSGLSKLLCNDLVKFSGDTHEDPGGGTHPRATKTRRGAGMSRQPSLRVVQRNDGLRQRIQALKAEHPFWGYHRIWASLRFVDQRPVNQKRSLRLLREHHRLVTPHQRWKAKQTPTRRAPKLTRPNEGWGIDMTKVLVQDVGWVSIVVVPDG